MTSSRLKEITEVGQAVWVDNLTRQMIDDGALDEYIRVDGLSGVTSNPTTFNKAMQDSDRYDARIREIAEQTDDPEQIFLQTAFHDIRDAADMLWDIWRSTEGRDGLVSFELPPALAYDSAASVAVANDVVKQIGRDNVLVKVPGTQAGVEAFRELTAQGISVNVTLLFAVQRYEQIADAYMSGLENRVFRGQPISDVVSVASFFVSRVDAKVDAALDSIGRPDLRRRAGVANAKIAYQSFRQKFEASRWQALQDRGANVQRPLWASTAPKDEAYPPMHYVDHLVGRDTVNTMKEETLGAARHDARVQPAIEDDVDAAYDAISQLHDVGVPLADIVERQLPEEGVDAFVESYDAAVKTVETKAES